MGHLMRISTQQAFFQLSLNGIKETSWISVADYKMKLLFCLSEETSSDWYGKRDATFLGVVYLFKKNGKTLCEVYDVCSNTDTKQDWYFSCLALEAAGKEFKAKHPII